MVDPGSSRRQRSKEATSEHGPVVLLASSLFVRAEAAVPSCLWRRGGQRLMGVEQIGEPALRCLQRARCHNGPAALQSGDGIR